MISNRIKKISKLIDINDDVADIGSDHGFLLIELANKNKNRKLIGIENKKGPYQNLCKNLDNSGLLNIKTSLSDGLDDVTSEYNCIVLAGMGYENIKSIIMSNNKKIENIDHIVVDCHRNSDLLRKFIISLGFYIDNEIDLIENNIYYSLISFKKGYKEYNALDLKYGPILRIDKTESFIKHIKNMINENNSILEKINENNKRNKLLKENNELNDLL